MSRVFFIVAVACFTSVVTAVPSYPAYLVPEHRSALRPLKAIEEVPVLNAIEQMPVNAYDYQIIPSDEYAVAEYDSSVEKSIVDLISSPITAVTTVVNLAASCVKSIVSKTLSVGKWIIVKGGMIILGMGLVIGFCAFTPFCTLIIEKPFAREIRSLNIPYLDNIEYYFNEAINKYHAMQKSL